MGLLQLLAKLFGKSYLNKIMGTRTNVAKPVQMDINSPFKKYSDEAYEDQKNIDTIEQKINEYGPYALSNKNPQELANFEANAKRLLQAKMRQGGVTENMIRTVEEAKKPKPEAEIIDMATQQKVDDTGIMKLKTDLGLPEGVDPNSPMGEMLLSTNRMNKLSKDIDTQENLFPESFKEEFMDFVKTGKNTNKSATNTKPNLKKASANLEEDIPKLTEREARAYSANIESFRRPIIRQLLLKDTKIKLPDDVRKSLENKMDLDKGADPKMDPLRLLDEYYDWNVNKLDELEDIRFTARDEFEAADEFLKKGGLEPKKDLGEKLKDLPDDIDPDALANGGRPGYAFGTGLKLFNLFKAKKTNVAKEIKRSLDNISTTGDSKYDADVMVDEIMQHLDIDRNVVDGSDISDLYGQAYEAVTMEAIDGVTPKLMQSIRRGADEDIKLSYGRHDKRIIPKGTTEEEIDLAILKGNFLRKYEGKIDSQLSKAIENDTNAQRVKEIIAEVEQATIMEQKGMSAEEIVNSLLDASNRKKQADGGRPGFAYGTIAKTLLTFLMDTLVKKKKFDPGLLKRVSEQKNGEKLIQELYEKEIGKVPLTTADKAPIPESTVTRNLFKDANERFNTKTPDKALLKAMDEVGGSASGDMKYDAGILADELAFQRGLIPEGGDITDIADQRKQMDLYDEAYSALSGQFLKNREIKKMQQFSKPTQTLKSIKEKGTMDISDPTIADEFDTFLRENDPENYKNLEQKIQLDNFDPKGRKKNASGGLNYLMGL